MDCQGSALTENSERLNLVDFCICLCSLDFGALDPSPAVFLGFRTVWFQNKGNELQNVSHVIHLT